GTVANVDRKCFEGGLSQDMAATPVRCARPKVMPYPAGQVYAPRGGALPQDGRDQQVRPEEKLIARCNGCWIILVVPEERPHDGCAVDLSFPEQPGKVGEQLIAQFDVLPADRLDLGTKSPRFLINGAE